MLGLSGSLPFLDEMYARYQAGEAIDPQWVALFGGDASRGGGNGNGAAEVARLAAIALPPAAVVATPTALVSGLWPLVDAYRTRGHLAADLDPLDMLERPDHPELDPIPYGLTAADLDRVVPGAGLVHGAPATATLGELIARLRRAYCGSVGLEFMHISSPAKKAWLAERIETVNWGGGLDPAVRRSMLDQLIAAETMERFVHVKYPGTKRFSLEGAETLIPLLDQVLTDAARLGAIEAVLGMPHRGRLNVLVQVMRRAPRDLFAEFEDIEPEASMGGGDVKYHLGYSCDRVDRNGHRMHLSLAFNPSHLEAVDPVVIGRVRAKQARHADWEHRQVVGVLIHGDAAFAGQGLVAETLNLFNLAGYRTGGTVHIVVNNQIGFTASPLEQRSTPYCTDVAQMIQCPIFHVNGEDVDAVAHVVRMAMEYRARFQSDVVIDMFCYRKFGHNEMDEPAFTQPLMYQRIQKKEAAPEIYGRRLRGEGVVSVADIETMTERHRTALEQELEIARSTVKRPRPSALAGLWSGYLGGPSSAVPDVPTGVARARLVEIAQRMTTPPPDFQAHAKIVRLLAQRAEMGRGERPLDWGMAELLAYGSLLWEGADVRLSGQDCSRGTFSHRHALITDIQTGAEHMTLGELHPEQGKCRIYDSPLSEAGVLGFDFGYSLDYPDALVIWEAQFGDFVNGAQVIIDQFIVSSEDKWHRLSGLVLFLPHGYEGQGPEHSSTRLERFLEACAEDNVQVVQPTTPAQIFHVLRRQVRRPWRKPLIVITPKSLLRLPAAVSPLEELVSGSFQRVLADPAPPPAAGLDRVFFCTGKIYYDLALERQKRNDTRTLLVRVEELYPWLPSAVTAAVSAVPAGNLREVVWVQDEPRNMGAATFIAPRLAALFGAGATRLRVVSRDESASPATGSHHAHEIEHRRLMDQAFDGATGS